MARLLTSHDPYHIHAILGLLALCHFIWRIARWHISGIAFTDTWEVLGVTIHGWLPLASLFLHVPKNRNEKSPMIWPEFRMHSIIFAWRHVLGAIACALNLWPKGLAARIGAKWMLIVATTCAADVATRKLGSSTQRTTNAMPYPPWVSPQMQIPIKDRYVAAQFAATAMSVYSRDDGYVAFIPLVGIQSAAFCMTLVRKHKLSPRGYHSIYSAALVLAGPWTLLWSDLTCGDRGTHFLAVFVAMAVVMPLRLYCRTIPKELLWLFGVILIETGLHAFALSTSPSIVLPIDDVLFHFLFVGLKVSWFVWYVAPYSILVFGPDSRVVDWSRRIIFSALYTASQNTEVKHRLSVSSEKDEKGYVKNQDKENTRPATDNNETSHDVHTKND
jgi:hypothetical protein